MTSLPRQSVFFPEIFSRSVQVRFDEPNSTSDGGAILLKALDESLGLTERLTSCLRDPRQEGKVRHEYLDLFRQRIFALSCGYEDANDAARASSDCMQRLLVGYEPGDVGGLASQPTLSRFENAVGRVELFRMADGLCDLVVQRHRKRLKKKVKRVTVDIDATVDPTHGAQQLTLFNGFYDTWCYLPLVGFLRFNNELQQYLFAAMLRPGVSGRDGLLGMLRRVLRKLRPAFPRAQIRVRLDGGFVGREVLDFLDEQRVEYLVGIPSNSVLKRRSKRLLGTARREHREQQQTVKLYGETRYAARSWKKIKRRVIYKAEVVRHEDREPRDNVRYVVTNMKQSPRFVYKEYVKRGDSENRIKELKAGLKIDRTSCASFNANQFRVLIAAAAFVFFQELQLRACRTSAATWQVSRIQLHLFKIAGKLVGSVRRLVLHLSQDHPWADLWLRLARNCGAAYT